MCFFDFQNFTVISMQRNFMRSEFLLFRPWQKRSALDTSIKINNRSTEQASEVVFLVVVLDEYLIWKLHISMLHVKFLRLLVYYMRQAFSFLNFHYALCIIL